MPVPLAHTIVYYVINRNGHADSHERSLLEICEQLDEEEQGACASETFSQIQHSLFMLLLLLLPLLLLAVLELPTLLPLHLLMLLQQPLPRSR